MSEMHSSLIHKVEELLTRKMFNCGICRQILQIPVILTENFGNVCHSCYEDTQQDTSVIGLENRILTELLKTLNLPCENESRGCIDRIPYDKIHKHKPFCRYQTVECELAPDCSWKGQYKDLVEHFQDHNKEFILKSIDDTFETIIPEENVLGTQILKTAYGLFVFHMKVTGNKLHYLLFAVDDLEKQLKYHFVMKFMDDLKTELNFICSPIEGSRKFMAFEEASSKMINLDLVKLNFTTNWKMYVTLDIDTDIYKVGRCLMQNSHAENKGMEYPCKLRRCGDSIEFSSNPMHHSQLCYYHPWKCPIPGCDQLFSFYSLLITHMRANHHEKGMCYFDRSSISLKKDNVSDEPECTYFNRIDTHHYYMYLILYDRIFHMHHINSPLNKTISWEVIHIGPIEERFQFVIEINKSESGEEISLRVSKECKYDYTNSSSLGKIELDSKLYHMFDTVQHDNKIEIVLLPK